MAENIFKNAKFGDKFRTRDGRMAIYLCNNIFDCGKVYVVYEGYTHSTRLMKDGHYWATTGVETNDDVVGKWQEPINDKKLDELAEEYDEVRQPNYWWTDNGKECVCNSSEVKEAFKSGYSKAKEL